MFSLFILYLVCSDTESLSVLGGVHFKVEFDARDLGAGLVVERQLPSVLSYLRERERRKVDRQKTFHFLAFRKLCMIGGHSLK